MKDVLVVGAMRSPIGTGTPKSFLKSLTPQNLSLQVLNALFQKTKISASAVEVFRVGSVVSLKSNAITQAPAREIALRAKMENASANITEKACSSGLRAIWEAAHTVRHESAELAVCGGVDMMSNVPDEVNTKALTCPITGKMMAELNDIKGRELGFTRDDYDRYAFESYERAKKHLNDYQLAGYLTPIFLPEGGEAPLLNFDQNVTLREVTPEWLHKLPPLPRCEITTAGNSSKKGDAAAYLMLASHRAAKKYGLKPLAKILSYAEQSGSIPKNFIEEPVCAAVEALSRAQLSFADIGAFWINEAFPGSPLNFIKETGVPWEIVNPYGGVIAFGHALGATGAVLPVNAICQGRKEGRKYVVVSLCNAIDEATAMVIEVL